jgi:hypothetical protein
LKKFPNAVPYLLQNHTDVDQSTRQTVIIITNKSNNTHIEEKCQVQKVGLGHRRKSLEWKREFDRPVENLEVKVVDAMTRRVGEEGQNFGLGGRVQIFWGPPTLGAPGLKMPSQKSRFEVTGEKHQGSVDRKK